MLSSILRLAAGAVALGGAALLIALPIACGAHATPEAGAQEGPAGSTGTMEESWKEIEGLLSEQKFQAALERVRELRDKAREAGDHQAWLRALVAEAQLGTALGGFERTVEFLRQAERPPGEIEGAVLDLYYAYGLVNYLRAYSYEVRQRERVASAAEAPLSAWTADQIVAEAHRALADVWGRRESWGTESLGVLGEYVRQNDYPARIRGTLRDAVSYLWAELLADSSLWRAEQSNRLFRLDLEALIAGDPGLEAADLEDPDVHPFAKRAAVLGDLESWHRRGDRPEAAFEARRARLERLHDEFDNRADRAAVREDLERALERLGRRFAWWSVGVAQLAQWVRDEGEPDSLVRARELALEGREAHPDSIGGQRCRHIVATIEAPSYSVTAMASDAAARRSIEITHRNLGELFFRAWAVDLVSVVESSDDYRLLGDRERAERYLASRSPDAQWRAELPETPDYRQHRTFVTPPMTAPGLYLVAVSADRAFRPQGNQLLAFETIVGDLVLLTRDLGDVLEVTVRSGATGAAVQGAEVDLYRYDYRRGHRRVSTRRTGASGGAEFRVASRDSYFVLARRGDELALDPSYRGSSRRHREGETTAALIWTDRSIYRPEQELLWKVVAYRGDGEGRFETSAAAALEVQLVDPNGEVVASASATTNRFGSASGAFTVPGGRLLGGWAVRTSLGGATRIRVEEYKRPTFEVTVAEPEEALRLNRPATLRGEARYYFGLPVVSGDLVWRVTREPVYPIWWFWRPPRVEPETVATGEAELDADGSFRLTFTPEADERLAESGGVTYRYRLSVDLTDEGGETRSATRVFRLGFVAVEARVDAERAWVRAGEPARFTVRRSDLDGAPRGGEGSWRLLRLEQPERTLLPAEQPLPPRDDGGFRTPGDELRPRWSDDYRPEQALRLWPDGTEVDGGRLVHGEDGQAELRLEGLAPGAYRLRYATRDDFGAEHETSRELLVVEAGRTELRLPAVAQAERPAVAVGDTARLLVHSGLDDQEMVLELYRDGSRVERRRLDSASGLAVVEIPIEKRHRGGFGFTLTCLRDHQLMVLTGSVFVPWDDRELKVEFATFRDRLRPGGRETWKVRLSGADETALAGGSAELLAYMYDRSLDLFAPHAPADPLRLYPVTTAIRVPQGSLGTATQTWIRSSGFGGLPAYPSLQDDRLVFLEAYGIGGPGRRMVLGEGVMLERMAMRSQLATAPAPPEAGDAAEAAPEEERERAELPDEPAAEVRTDFSETAFWEPHLVLGDDGTVSFEFTVPDSVTEWNVWVHALTTDLRAGAVSRRTRTVKELLVRPYLPRFLREGDRLRVAVVVNNAGDAELAGSLDFELFDPDTEASLAAAFGLEAAAARGVPFRVAPGAGAELGFELAVPARPGAVAVRVVGRAGELSDGELRELPVLPGRMHLAQSRFVTLDGADRRELRFEDLAADDDPSRIDEQLVVTLDAQLFYGVLRALPYLATYPYECTEQLLNRFLSTGIVASLYDGYPAVARMAEGFAARETPLEAWDADDPNRRMALEETPWLVRARGGEAPGAELVNVLDPRITRATRDASLAKLVKAQTSSGGFPWWPGGPPSPYMTLYLLQGFSRALEFGVEVPRDPVVKAWAYLHRHYLDVWVREAIERDCCWEMITFLNYVLSSYPDAEWTGGVFSEAERRRMLEFSFGHWRRHSPLSKAQLTLTLVRAGRAEDARLVFDSVMDSARTTRDEGTFWAPEERSWLWYNDTIETHAFALRTLSELEPDDARRHGLVQWLFLNKKLNHWKSTRATAEVLYSLVRYLELEGALGVREEVAVTVGRQVRRFVFEPDRYGPVEPHGALVAGEELGGGGQAHQLVVPGERLDPATMSTVLVEKESPGFVFASASWHFSTERLPEEARGDFFAVRRAFYRRVHDGREWVLEPLAEGQRLEVGDQVEVHLTLRSKHAAEYVHLRDPRAAGFEPESQVSSFKWDLGIGWYEEVRDSGTNFFFEWLPVGEYEFKYRLRAAAAGAFRVAPATLQSMYAPEFNAYSAGARIDIGR